MIAVVDTGDALRAAASFADIWRRGGAALAVGPELAQEVRACAANLPDLALAVATSGSGGAPQVVLLTRSALDAAAEASRSRLGLGRDDVWLCCLPLYHIGGISIIYRCLRAGATAVTHQGFDPARVWESLENERITHLSLVPAMLARLIDHRPGPPPGALRRVLVGGAALSALVAGRALDAGWPLCPTYGMSETASQAATLESMPKDWHPGLVGPPLDDTELCIVPDGRIWVKGPMLMAGYANPEGRLGVGLEENGWFKTGDLGEIDAKGRLVVRGRADWALTSGGETFQPEEVENVIAACPGVREAALTARPDAIWGDRLVGLVVGDADKEQVLQWCRRHLRGGRRPREVKVVDGLPRTTLGKLDRAALRRMA